MNKEITMEKSTVTKTNEMHYVPSSYTEMKQNELGVVYFNSSKKVAIAYTHKAGKSRWHYSYGKVEQMNQAVDSFLNRLIDLENEKIAEREKRKAADAKVIFPIGTILNSSWGYDQTNVSFYKVIKTTKKTVTVVGIAKNHEQSEGYSSMSSHVTPDLDNVGTKETRYYLAGSDSIKINSSEYASLWNGKPCYCSWYA